MSEESHLALSAALREDIDEVKTIVSDMTRGRIRLLEIACDDVAKACFEEMEQRIRKDKERESPNIG